MSLGWYMRRLRAMSVSEIGRRVAERLGRRSEMASLRRISRSPWDGTFTDAPKLPWRDRVPPELRKQLAQKSGELQKFFEESQKSLYEMEEQQMGSLSKTLDEKVDQVIKQVAQKNNIKAVFEKRFFYWGDEATVKDLTEEVLQALNGGKAPAAAPAGKPAAKPAGK